MVDPEPSSSATNSCRILVAHGVQGEIHSSQLWHNSPPDLKTSLVKATSELVLTHADVSLAEQMQITPGKMLSVLRA